MNRAGFLCVLAGLLSACSKSRPPPAEEPAGEPAPSLVFRDGGVDIKKRLSSYVGAKVTPEFRGCWAKLEGEGAVAVDLEFKKADKTWTFDRVVLQQASLAKGQEAIAVRCLESIVRGTSFAADLGDELEHAGLRLVHRQGWPVPLPAEGERLEPAVAERRFGGGVPGAITIEGCSACVSNPNGGLKCERRDTGTSKDCEEREPNVCVVTEEPCVKDIIYGVGGGLIIY